MTTCERQGIDGDAKVTCEEDANAMLPDVRSVNQGGEAGEVHWKS